eukprot:2384766-Rhodomonas_salina.1
MSLTSHHITITIIIVVVVVVVAAAAAVGVQWRKSRTSGQSVSRQRSKDFARRAPTEVQLPPTHSLSSTLADTIASTMACAALTQGGWCEQWT